MHISHGLATVATLKSNVDKALASAMAQNREPQALASGDGEPHVGVARPAASAVGSQRRPTYALRQKSSQLHVIYDCDFCRMDTNNVST